MYQFWGPDISPERVLVRAEGRSPLLELEVGCVMCLQQRKPQASSPIDEDSQSCPSKKKEVRKREQVAGEDRLALTCMYHQVDRKFHIYFADTEPQGSSLELDTSSIK